MSGILLTVLLFVIVVAAIFLILYVADWMMAKFGVIPRPASMVIVAVVGILCIALIVGFLAARGLVAL